jgi:hypothetical protein
VGIVYKKCFSHTVTYYPYWRFSESLQGCALEFSLKLMLFIFCSLSYVWCYDLVLGRFQHLVRIQAVLQSPARMDRLLEVLTIAIPPHHKALFPLLVPPASIRCMRNMGMWTAPAGPARLPVRWVCTMCVCLNQYVLPLIMWKIQVQWYSKDKIIFCVIVESCHFLYSYSNEYTS